MSTLSIEMQIDEMNAGVSILEAKNNLRDVIDRCDDRLDAIAKRLDGGEDEYTDY